MDKTNQYQPPPGEPDETPRPPNPRSPRTRWRDQVSDIWEAGKQGLKGEAFDPYTIFMDRLRRQQGLPPRLRSRPRSWYSRYIARKR